MGRFYPYTFLAATALLIFGAVSTVQMIVEFIAEGKLGHKKAKGGKPSGGYEG